MVTLESSRNAPVSLCCGVHRVDVLISAHHSDSMTKAVMSTYEPSQMVSVLAEQKALSKTTPHTSPPIDPDLSVMQGPLKNWYTYSEKRSIPAQGIYTYDSTCGSLRSLQTSIVNYSISIRGSKIEGNTQDSLGTAENSGNIDRIRRTSLFLKIYVRTRQGKPLYV